VRSRAIRLSPHPGITRRPGRDSIDDGSVGNADRLPIRSMPIASDMGGAGFEPAKAVPPDLQSGPFGRLGIHPRCHSHPAALGMLPHVGWGRGRTSPLPYAGRAGGETRTHNPRFTKPKLYRLSYASDRIGVGISSDSIPDLGPGGIQLGREIVHY